MLKYFLGVDNGGTTTKAAVFEETGEQLAVASVTVRPISEAPGFSERDMEEMWRTTAAVIRRAIDKAGIDKAQIACVACCGHGKGLYLWGKDGRPVRRGIISTDCRAWEYPVNWERSGVDKLVLKKTASHILPSQPVALLAWLRDNEPEMIGRTKYIFECKDYIRFRLTGEARGEISDYSGTGFVNLYTRAYDTELLSAFALDDCLDKLPPLCRAAEICGRVTRKAAEETGLAAGTPVAGGAFDIDACALAVDLTDEENLCMIAGTWSINECISRSPVNNGSVLMNSLFCDPAYYLLEESSPTSAGNLEWIIDTVLPPLRDSLKAEGASIYDCLNTLAAKAKPDELCPVFLPFVLGTNAQVNARGSLVGFEKHHGAAQLVRGIYEGVAFSHRQHYEKLLKARGGVPKRIRLAGGAARSPVWVRIFADTMQVPVECVEASETGAAGCAIIAAAACGAYPSLAKAAHSMCRIRPAIMPNSENARIMDAKYEIYRKTVEVLGAVWDAEARYRFES